MVVHTCHNSIKNINLDLWVKKVAPIFEFFSKCCYIIYMRESTNNFVTQKKHQDMEANNIQETQHRDAQQMRVDEFAAMLGQVQKPRDV